MNKVTLIGHLGADPEVRYTQNREAIATIRIATTEISKDKSSGERKETTGPYQRCQVLRSRSGPALARGCSLSALCGRARYQVWSR
ncbi:MAG: single-stranded DNA-binding protein [Candidatus Accumulibacter meliphilus]|uniref:single-stranded DNA-binding protein n=1 Tax=Candidatus Accumulibacter meliphilus TaxID=2211374 RepID=UPI002FC38639